MKTLEPSYIVNPTSTPATFDVVVLYVDGVPACSGAVVSPTAVLTAAHCVSHASPRSLSITIGTAAPSRPLLPVSVGVDPAYDAERHLHDLAVLQFDQPLASQPLPISTAGLEVGTVVSLAGIGMTDPSTPPVEGFTPAVNEGTARVAQVEKSWVRLDGAPSFSCQGDSGGPVVVQRGGTFELVGAVTAGDQNCREYSIVARVDNNAWLTSELRAPPVVGGCSAAGSAPALATFLFAVLALRRRFRRAAR